MGKLFTNIVNERLTRFVEVNNLLCENQTGFRKNYCTMDNCFMLKCIIHLFILKKKLFCAFVDNQKAFDTIWRDGLWQKLTKIGIYGKVYNVIVNMYKQVKSCFCSWQKDR